MRGLVRMALVPVQKGVTLEKESYMRIGVGTCIDGNACCGLYREYAQAGRFHLDIVHCPGSRRQRGRLRS